MDFSCALYSFYENITWYSSISRPLGGAAYLGVAVPGLEARVPHHPAFGDASVGHHPRAVSEVLISDEFSVDTPMRKYKSSDVCRCFHFITDVCWPQFH